MATPPATTHAPLPDQAPGKPLAAMVTILDQTVSSMAAALVRRHLQEVEECLTKATLASKSSNVSAVLALLHRLSVLLEAESSSLSGAEGGRK